MPPWIDPLRRRLLRWLPPLGAALLLLRVAAEWVGAGLGDRPVGVALFLAAGGLLLAALLYQALRRSRYLADWQQTWPLLFCWLYVLAPAPTPAALWAALLLSGAALLLSRREQIPWPGAPWIAGGVALGGLLLYLATLAPGVLPADSGEFQLRAAQLGVPHPPGFPLYTMVAHLFTRLPPGDGAAWRVNLFSALTSAATLGVICLLVIRLTGSRLAGVVAGLALAGATTFWAQATTANIRSATALLAALGLLLLLPHRGEHSDWVPLTPRRLFWLALVLTSGVVHHVSLGFMTLAALLYIIAGTPNLLLPSRRWLPGLAGMGVGLLPLLYLPLRAGAPGAPADIATLDGFLFHVLGLGFRGDLFYFLTPAALADRLRVMVDVLRFQFAWPLLLGGVAGWGLLLRPHYRGGSRAYGLLLLGAFLIHSFITATYRAPQTVEYMLPAYVPLVVGLGVTAAWLRQQTVPYRPVGASLLALLLLAGGWQLTARAPSFLALRAADDTSDYTNAVLDAVPDGGTLLAGWHWATPAWYLTEIENRGKDVDVVYVFPAGEPYPATWAQRTAELLADGVPTVTTHFEAAAFAPLPPPQPAGEAFLFPTQPLTRLPAGFTPLSLRLGDSIDVAGFQLDRAAVAQGDGLALTVAWSPGGEAAAGPLSLFAHLVAPDGRLLAQDDVGVTPRGQGLTLTRLTLTPRPGAWPGDYTLFLGGYRPVAGGLEPLPDPAGETRSRLTGVAVTPQPWAPYSGHPTRWAEPDGRRVLVGYDWDNTVAGAPRLYRHWQVDGGYVTDVVDTADGVHTLPPLRGAWGLIRERTVRNDGGYYVPLGQGIVWSGPLLAQERVQPGETVRLTQRFHSSRPLSDDLAVSLRLVGYEADGFTWAWADLDEAFGVPAMGGIPTLKWIAGSSVLDPHRLTVDPAAAPGQQVGVLLGLYDTFTNRPVPVLDERLSAASPWRTAVVAPPPP